MSAEVDQKYVDFVARVTTLGKELQVTPGEAVCLFGSIVRGFVEHARKLGHGTVEDLSEQAIRRFAKGFGGDACDIKVTLSNRGAR